MDNYYQLDGLQTLVAAVRGKYLLVSDNAGLISDMLGNVNRRVEMKPASFMAGFNHCGERNNFYRLATLVDRPDLGPSGIPSGDKQPQFFSENIASLSTTLAGISSEKIVVRDRGDKVLQTVTYEWSQ
jgi:hypothetical protein